MSKLAADQVEDTAPRSSRADLATDMVREFTELQG
jgi:glycyl-tRNA synthetase beta subunit